MKTGVFFHDLFSKQVWHIIADKFRNFPDAMRTTLALRNVELIKPNKVSKELMLKVHTPRFLENLKNAWYCEGAYLTVGGCVQAGELVMEGKLRNALAFGVAAGHHAERDYAWGGTYASVSGPLIVNLQEKFPGTKVAIIDTDSHHGNGTRDVTFGNQDVLHVCFCSSNMIEDKGTKICVDSGYNSTDDKYLNLVKKEFIERLKDFRPDLILHLLGHDTAIGDYGDRGLTREFFLRLVRILKEASKICNERYLINTHGGSSLDICEYVYPNAIRILAEDA
ncbi:MAG: histone deacetylase [Candidatus Hodarchaeota archaeon]